MANKKGVLHLYGHPDPVRPGGHQRPVGDGPERQPPPKPAVLGGG